MQWRIPELTLRSGPAVLAACLSAQAVEACDTALILAVDVSNSVDAGEYRIQTDGIAAALRDPVVIDSMVLGRNRLAVLQWSGAGMQALVIPWTSTYAPSDVLLLADRVQRMPRAFHGGNTALGEAMRESTRLALQNPDCNRRVIDVSGDGADNAGTDVGSARRAAMQAGVVINGLSIEGMGPAITTYYRRYVITKNGFVETARGFTDFARAIRAKIRREVSRVTG